MCGLIWRGKECGTPYMPTVSPAALTWLCTHKCSGRRKRMSQRSQWTNAAWVGGREGDGRFIMWRTTTSMTMVMTRRRRRRWKGLRLPCRRDRGSLQGGAGIPAGCTRESSGSPVLREGGIPLEEWGGSDGECPHSSPGGVGLFHVQRHSLECLAVHLPCR